ncbi:MAG: YeeE/YedE family protein, partial [Gammaproteobacteria bacterium]|nr:YeeE/YedE family protein [Gammaproteobacteria bacterium]
MKSHILAAVAGLLFGLGLAISQMVNPQKVLDFLDIFGDWDPSLLLVIGAATGLTMISFRWVLNKPQPFFADSFRLPTKTDVDKRLIFGSVLF